MTRHRDGVQLFRTPISEKLPVGSQLKKSPSRAGFKARAVACAIRPMSEAG